MYDRCGHLRAVADARVLDLHVGARLGGLAEDRSGAKVTEGADDRIGADVRVDRDGVRADLGAGRDPCRAAEDGERMDRHVGLDLDRRLDPGGGRIDDRHAGEHVPLVDAVAQHGGRLRELDARVDAVGLAVVGGDVRADLAAVARRGSRSRR